MIQLGKYSLAHVIIIIRKRVRQRRGLMDVDGVGVR
jgi:hypothetical protein